MRQAAFAFLFTAAGLAAANVASAQTLERCRVVDPTGTPLNLRAGPNGAVIGTIAVGRLVRYIKDQDDARGRTWVQIAPWNDGGPGRPLGWVFREFIACF